MIPAEFKIEGQLGYRDRIQLLDLLFWRITSRADTLGYDLVDREFITKEAQHEIAGIVGRAREELDIFRMFGSFDFDEMAIERTLDRADFPYRSRPYGVFYPILPTLRPGQSVVEWITQQERLALAGSGVALAAAGYEPFVIDQIHTFNPISIKGNLFGAAAIIAALTAVYGAYHHEARTDQMANVCASVADRYQAETERAGLNPKKLHELGETFRECLKSPVLSSTPMSVTIGEKPE